MTNPAKGIPRTVLRLFALGGESRRRTVPAFVLYRTRVQQIAANVQQIAATVQQVTAVETGFSRAFEAGMGRIDTGYGNGCSKGRQLCVSVIRHKIG